MKIRIGIAALVVMTLVATAGAAFAQDTDAQIKKLPGYVDFQGVKLFGGKEAKVEVYLKEPMLNLVSKFMKDEDPETYDILRKLKLVRVQVFDVDDEMTREFNEVTSKVTAMLDGKGWERIVRVREEDDNVDIYLRPSEGYESILGIVVMVTDGNEAVFVNIVGEINPDDISKLGDHFDIDELDDIHIDKDKKRHRD